MPEVPKGAWFVDLEVARMVLARFYPKSSYSDTEMVQWIASQLKLKQQGSAHADVAIAVYEEHAKTT